jgi:subtilisin family serine protease
MPRRQTVAPGATLALGLGGVLAGHMLTYGLLVPNAHARALELARTGHGYLSSANAIGVWAAIAGLAAIFLGAVLRPNEASRQEIVWRLVAFQLSAFAAMELCERIASGAPLHDLVPLLTVGVPAQLLVAGVIALFVRLLVRTVAAVARNGRSPALRSPAALEPIVAPGWSLSSAPMWGAAEGRGPPPSHRP